MSTPLAGVNAMFFMRADWQEIKARQAARTTETVWAPSPTLGLNGATYAGIVTGGSYCTGPALSMDPYSMDDEMQDDPLLAGYNVPAIVDTVVRSALTANAQVPQGGSNTSDVGLLLGCDFEWQNAETWCAARAMRCALLRCTPPCCWHHPDYHAALPSPPPTMQTGSPTRSASLRP